MIDENKLYGALRKMGKKYVKPLYRDDWTPECPFLKTNLAMILLPRVGKKLMSSQMSSLGEYSIGQG